MLKNGYFIFALSAAVILMAGFMLHNTSIALVAPNLPVVLLTVFCQFLCYFNKFPARPIVQESTRETFLERFVLYVHL